ncbi:MAG: CDP-diacylglycerol--glycerol-3-phosphate 3-phosphatidyltransferase [Alphaproteobacteria bacterium]|nr:CDP-diacylglycerol--glycerol-3-phosphate 3-phosphatidyltransferase [Alphaproteobacteria bacterium]
MITSLPNLLTLSRIAVIPVLVALFFVGGAPARWIACALFTVACITDYFDGYIARMWRQDSDLGRFLDPIADKLLVASTLFMLVAMDQLGGLTILPALVILCREILVSGLREFLAGVRLRVPVSRLAKWKTAIQMTAIGFLVVGEAGPPFIPTLMIGEIGLWIAAGLTLITGYDYLIAGLRHIAGEREPERPAPSLTAPVKRVEPARPAG